jgi:hypothetical protein
MKGRTTVAAPRARARSKAGVQIPTDSNEATLQFGAESVRLTNLLKPFWPELGLTKLDLLQYYADVSEYLLPHLLDRAMVMKRYPNGAAGKFFLQKRAPEPRPEWIDVCSIEHDSGNVIDFPIIRDLASLLWVINLGCIDLNPCYARCDDVDRPDYLHFDLDPALARRWFNSAGSDLDGLMAKRLDVPYCSGERTGMEKIKPVRTADCVVGGFRYAQKTKVLGSLLLGLYNDAGELDHIGFCSSLKAPERKSLLTRLRPLIEAPGFTGHAPGGPSRWSAGRSTEWEPLRPEFVVEVSYDHFTNGRFRHGTRLIRWRPDKAPEQCRMEQVLLSGRVAYRLLEK